jgi:DNA-binding NarL/FixJ family response regulator
MMAQALLMDAHPIVRKAIKQVLQTAFPFLGVKEFSDGNDVVREICAYPWALVVMDINLPGKNGLHILREAKARCPGTPIIVFSLFPEDRYAARAYRAGAIAYLSKNSSLDHFINTVGTVLDRRQPKKRRESTVSESTVLSDREVQVLRLFVKGLSRKEIARALKIKERTVSTYKTKLIEKLDLRSFAELIDYAIEEGIN